MKQLQIDVPEKHKEKVEEVLDNYSSDFISYEAERKDKAVQVFEATVESKDIDELEKELKGIKEIKSGELVIRIFDEKSIIEKGQKTRGSSTQLSQEEVYSKAQASSSFGQIQWALMGISSSIAALGLITDNIIAVIGAMMLAPILKPVVSSSVSLTIGDKTLLRDSMKTSMLSVALAVIISLATSLPLDPKMNSTLELVTTATELNLLLSLLVGFAAALAFVTSLQDQIAGVAVSIALVPPLSAIGVSISMLSPLLLFKSVTIASINILAVLLAGTVSLKALGFKPSTYYRKKSAEEMKTVFYIAISLMVISIISLLFISQPELTKTLLIR